MSKSQKLEKAKTEVKYIIQYWFTDKILNMSGLIDYDRFLTYEEAKTALDGYKYKTELYGKKCRIVKRTYETIKDYA